MVLFMTSIPIAGLAVDLGTFYLIQSKLQAAVDAGALAGARSLARGIDTSLQTQSAQTTAAQYVTANFPNNYMGTSGLTVPTPSVQLQASSRNVAVNASVQVNHLFLRWFGSTASTVTASATATRRDVNVILVVDRSGSLATSNSCTPLKQSAVEFVNKFAESRDYVGLVTYATSYSVAVPMAQTFKTGVTNGINAITCSGSTSSAAGLWLGYQTLAALQQPAALNVILFFTDGDPTSVTANFAIKGTSSCTNKSNRVGVITVAGNEIRGLMSPTPASPIANNDALQAPNSSGCAYAASWQGNRYLVGNDITGIPSTDQFGNSLTFGFLPVNTSGGLLAAPSNATNADNFQNATYNAGVSAAVRIRSGVSPNNGFPALNNVVIFAIGLGGSGQASHDFMRYVANDPDSPNYNSNQIAGTYIFAPTSGDLAEAFNRVASEVLRLAR